MEFAIKKNGMYESIEFYSNVIQTEGAGVITLQAKVIDGEFVNYSTISKINQVTKLDLPMPVLFKLVSKCPFNYTIPYHIPRYSNKQKVEDYLYDISYGNIDYKYAYEHFVENEPGGCSAIRNGNWFGRNFDWLYNNLVQFIVHTPESLSRHAVLGVSGIIPGIENSNVDDDNIIVDGIDMFKLLPFYLLDGINSCGVFCTHNVVPLDDAATLEVYAKIEERDRVCAPMLVRFILDKFNSAESAIDYLINYTTVYFSDTMLCDWGYLSHFMIGDSDSTYIVEFIDGEIKVSCRKYITNFPITGVEFNKQLHIQYPPTLFGMNSYGTGLERWDIITDLYKSTNSLEGMRNCLEAIKYSNTYTEDFPWVSELVGKSSDDGGIIIVDTDPTKCTEAIEEVLDDWENKDRNNPKVWITCHSSIYDIKNKILHIKNLENLTEYTFNV